MAPHNNIVSIAVGEIENICFVVMPFDPLFQTQYERVIQPAVEGLGLKCVRGDEIYSKPQIMNDIWNSIRASRLIIAELTGRNPNVFYEIGLAHAIGKPIILLTRNEDDVPFDLKALRYRYYNVNDPYWGDNLSKAIQSMVKAVLNQPGLNNYLDGVSATLQLPEVPEEKDLFQQQVVTPVDVSGDWTGKFKRYDGIEHRALLHIVQQGEKLDGTMIVTYESSRIVTVIQELMTGSVKEAEVSLNGVSYTYISQGYSAAYNLDNFFLTVSPDKSRMAGSFSSISGTGEAAFSKQPAG